MLATLQLPLSDPVLSRNMYSSKLLRAPLELIKRHVESVVDGTSDAPKIKFLADSAHDWTVATLMMFLDATNGSFENIPFASHVKLELHSTDGCSDEECFWVEAIYNGELLSYEGDCKDATHCTYPEFLHVLQRKGFVYTESHYNDECAKNWTHPDDEVFMVMKN